MSLKRIRTLAAASPAALLMWAAGPAQAQSGPAAGAPPPLASAEIVVIGARDGLRHIPGSGATIEEEDLERARVFTVNEALRQVPGLFPRDEEGLGLRPNIGVRGLSPTRSSKALLLEDGLPLTYAPYGDNATYSHPPLRRFQRIEVLKGASQVRFGPNTVGGVINFITPDAPEAFGGNLRLAAGDNGYGEAELALGGPVLGARAFAHLSTTHFDGVRANHGFEQSDAYVKIELDLAPNHDLTVRLGYAREDSQVSYSGLTLAEFTADRFANPFPNDRFELERFTASATHGWTLAPDLVLRTSAYTLWFDRDWWRQSSNSGQRPNDASDPACGGMANLITTCGNEGRLREYNQYGLETRLTWDGALAGIDARVELGARWHTERQNRLQVNADAPNGRTPGASVNGGVRELNLRYAEAWSAFVSAEVDFGRLALQPGLRVEHITFERLNGQSGQRGETDLTSWIPGLGATFDVTEALTIYAGVHRGFAPPRVEDILTGAGGVVELDAEESVNWELGLRGDLRPGLALDVGLFLLDFDNQIVPASVAGGVGATLTSAGETRQAGVESALRGSFRDMGLLTRDDIFFRAAVTYVPEAEFTGQRFSGVSGFTSQSVSGNRLPYAPEWIAAAAIGYARGDWVQTQIEVQHTGEMFTDDLNTRAVTANGQRGRIASATVVNWALDVTPVPRGPALFVTVKNVLDAETIVDRSRGILPGAPRLAQAGLSWKF